MSLEQTLSSIVNDLGNGTEPGVLSSVKTVIDEHPDLMERAYNMGISRFGGQETDKTVEKKLEALVYATYPTDTTKQQSLAAVFGDLSRAGFVQAWNDFNNGKNVVATTTDKATGEKSSETLLGHDAKAPPELLANIKLRAGLTDDKADTRLNKIYNETFALAMSAGGNMDETTMAAVAASVAASNQKSESFKNGAEKAGDIAGSVAHTSTNILRKAAKVIIVTPVAVAGAATGSVISALRSGTRLFTQHSVRSNAKRLMGEAGSAEELKAASDVLKDSRGHGWLVGVGGGAAAAGLGANALVNVPFKLGAKAAAGAGNVAGGAGKATLKLFGADWDGPSFEQMEAERLTIQAAIEAAAKINNPQITAKEVEAALAPITPIPAIQTAQAVDQAPANFASASGVGERSSKNTPDDLAVFHQNIANAPDYNERLRIARLATDVVELKNPIGQAALIATDKVSGIDEVKAKRDAIFEQLNKKDPAKYNDITKLEVVEEPGKDGKSYFAIKGITGPEATAAYAQAQAEERARSAGVGVASTMDLSKPFKIDPKAVLADLARDNTRVPADVLAALQNNPEALGEIGAALQRAQAPSQAAGDGTKQPSQVKNGALSR